MSSVGTVASQQEGTEFVWIGVCVQPSIQGIKSILDDSAHCLRAMPMLSANAGNSVPYCVCSKTESTFTFPDLHRQLTSYYYHTYSVLGKVTEKITETPN